MSARSVLRHAMYDGPVCFAFDVLLVGLAIVAACTPAPVTPPPVPDAHDAAPPTRGDATLPPPASCADACATLRRIGCAEGMPSSCQAAMQRIQDLHLLTAADGHDTTCADVAAALGPQAVESLGASCALGDGGK